MPAKRQPSAPDEEGRAGDPRQERYEVTGNWKHLKKRPRKSQPSAEEMLDWVQRRNADLVAPPELWMVLAEGARTVKRRTARAAIRAAMAAERKERRAK